MSSETIFEFGILEIRDLGFSVNEDIAIPTPVAWKNAITFEFNLEENWVLFIVTVGFIDDKENEFINGKVLTRFFVNDLKLYHNTKHPNIISFPDDQDITLYSLAFTHARAILAKNLSGSKYEHVFIPIVNPSEYFKVFRNSPVNSIKEKSKKKATKRISR